ncbi:hypothetical protein PC129_g20572 [Phytophthora cactorum]|uniref:Uncharacterized protein n=1 Tax=Phytophthora cactorum TaxID=29920 RepID=A0A8T1H883_9STRA|nr:hypothetical protein Pcac1_g27631 [Phytophthora cactorum]KAG2809910.1 hypothetical protein PC113_g23822 [Phytophthora cactorum]KAG2877708.1 hypothetical protein PC114_g23493 [Phytophthora cactorum]KAG2884122.1 hypothetical protein PC117_g25868 [Phytophthora cactorum]KAG2971524.1 hypothetical protein PC119_g23370 [Phytophthora cactorum]
MRSDAVDRQESRRTRTDDVETQTCGTTEDTDGNERRSVWVGDRGSPNRDHR